MCYLFDIRSCSAMVIIVLLTLSTTVLCEENESTQTGTIIESIAETADDHQESQRIHTDTASPSDNQEELKQYVPQAQPASTHPEEPRQIPQETSENQEHASEHADMNESDENEEEEEKEEPLDPGIVHGHTFGVMGRAVLGEEYETQSKWGFDVLYLFPTTMRSQMRIRAGMPLSRSENTQQDGENTYPNPWISAEHEWGWRYAGVYAGLSFMYLQGFSKTFTGSSYAPVTVLFEDSYNVNLVLGFRGGKHRNGFRGRITLPLNAYFVSSDSLMGSYFFEGSALYAYGKRRVRAGIGIEGALEQYRAVLPAENHPNDIYDDDLEYFSANSHFVMGPVAKLAVLLGQHHVAVLSLDIIGTIFRPIGQMAGGSSNTWPPNISLRYVFSPAPITAPSGYDGIF